MDPTLELRSPSESPGRNTNLFLLKKVFLSWTIPKLTVVWCIFSLIVSAGRISPMMVGFLALSSCRHDAALNFNFRCREAQTFLCFLLGEMISPLHGLILSFPPTSGLFMSPRVGFLFSLLVANLPQNCGSNCFVVVHVLISDYFERGLTGRFSCPFRSK